VGYALRANRDDFFIRYDEKFRIYPSEEKKTM